MRHFSIANFFSLLYWNIDYLNSFTMLSRKLFALFILIWALGFFVLIYLYFFVYYTSTLVIVANEENYSWELVSIKNAQNRKFTCIQKECIIEDIPPFDYRLTLSKDNFKSISQSINLSARTAERIEVMFERQARLSLETLVIPESSWDVLSDIVLPLPEGFPRDNIRYESIVGTQGEIFISAENLSFIYDSIWGNLTELPYRIPVIYIKAWTTRWSYQVVTEVGTFLYSRQSGVSTFQYLFFDYVVLSEEQIIWVIRPDETEKRQNFSLPESRETLIVLYNSRTRDRRILLSSSQLVTRIFSEEGEVYVVTAEDIRYKLENF